MRSYRLERFDAPPAFCDIEKPSPGTGEALVRIAACGLNFADLLMIRGGYQEKPPLPVTLGLELSGTIEALGAETHGPAPGTRVAVFAGSGGLAEYGTFPAARCVPIPDKMSMEDAAGFQIAYLTSHLALDRRARLQANETLLVLGAGGGVGLTAVEIGALMGAKVVACARGTDKLAAAKAAGAHHLIDSDREDIRVSMLALGGADVVYDPVGGDQFAAALRATNPEGRVLVIGFASGSVPPIAANHLLVKNLSVIGLYMGGYLKFRPEALSASLDRLLGWYSEGRLRPHVSHLLPLERVEEGLELLRDRRATGKVVITL